MSSEVRAPSQIPANKLYINVGSLLSTITDTNLSTVYWNNSAAAGPIGSANKTIAGYLSTAGTAVLRDMGKTVYLPGPTSATVSTVLRKVQLVVPNFPGGVTGDSGFTPAGTMGAGDYFTGYIQLGGLTYGGGAGSGAGFAPVARLN
jgi:hypothetical protein